MINTTTTCSLTCIDSVDDDFVLFAINYVVGLARATIFENDNLFGFFFIDANVLSSILDDNGMASLTFNFDGIFNIPAKTTVGTYTVEYQICESADLLNCDSAFVSLLVNGDIDAAIIILKR